jgi:hypothetical protein
MHRVIDDDELWKEFKAKLESSSHSGAITNARTQQILQEFVLKEQQKREATEGTSACTGAEATASPERGGLVTGMVRNLSGGALKSLKALEREIADDDDSDDEVDRDIDGPDEEWGEIVELRQLRHQQRSRSNILGLGGRRRSIATSALTAAWSAGSDEHIYGEQAEDQIIAGDTCSLVKKLERRLSMAASGQTACDRRRSSVASVHSDYSRPRRSSSIASGAGGASVSSIYEASTRNNLAATAAAKRASMTSGAGGSSMSSIYEASARNNLAATAAAKRAIDIIGGADETAALRDGHQDISVTPPNSSSGAPAAQSRQGRRGSIAVRLAQVAALAKVSLEGEVDSEGQP